jgi:hypothetical protein
MDGVSGVSVTVPSASEVAALDGRALDDLLWELEVARRQIEAAAVVVVDRADRSRQFLADGHRSVRSWVEAVTNCSAGDALRRQQSARALRILPVVAGEFAAGRVGVAQVHELGRLGANLRAVGQLPASQEVLLSAAKELRHRDFTIVTKRWECLADPDGAHRRHEIAHQGRLARIFPVGVEYRVEATMGSLQGQGLRDIFDRFVDAEFHADWETAKAKHGDDVNPSVLERTDAQRRADALSAIFETAASASTTIAPLPSVANLVIDYDSYEQHLRHALDGTPVDIDPASVRSRRCETTDGIPVDPQAAVVHVLLGRVRRIVVDAAGVIVDVGRTRRLFTGPIRQAAKALEPSCGWLGCYLRGVIAELDHAIPYSAGGTTDAANAELYCGHHNRHKHHHGYTARRQPDGTWTLHRPDGTIMQPPDANDGPDPPGG